MGKIYYVMGKSASGKDTIYRELKQKLNYLKTVTLYTTRPKRSGEIDGETYFFIYENELEEKIKTEKIIEKRTYNTSFGPWIYFTLDDGQINLEDNSYLMIGTLDSYEKTRDYFGYDKLIPIYIEVEDGIRLKRALEREQKEPEPKYQELCRRFLADEEDFKIENLKRCGINKSFKNVDFDECIHNICCEIQNTSSL